MAVSSSWGTEGGHLVSRWSASLAREGQYDAPWIRQTPGAQLEPVSALALALDFTRLSTWAGKGWFERALSPLR
jgi:hypothetical protein